MKSEKLLHFASKTADGKSDYYGYCVRERRDILTVFKDFGITNEVPLAYLIQGAGRQRPREFSISSSYNQAADGQAVVDLTMLVTQFETKLKRQITGVCSGWLSSITPLKGDKIPIWLKKGSMIFPEGRPLIMVGPGTGVAAFRAVIQQYAHSGQQLVLVFGCRSQDADYYYGQEWEQLQAKGVKLAVITAFSRDKPDEGKIYVQHKIRDNAQMLSALILKQNANIYVSGKAKFMPKSVEKAFSEII